MAKRKRAAVCDLLRDDILEAYLLGRLPGQQMGREDDPEVQSIEEHLLWCEACQARAEAEDEAIKALRAALMMSEPPSPARKPAKVKAKAMAIGTGTITEIEL